MRRFYGVGVGPGDPELMTVKGIKTIERSDYVFVPRSRGESTARVIAGQYLEGKTIVELDFPMGEDNGDRYRDGAETIDKTVGDGDTACFLTLGDPMTYSTYIYLMEELKSYDFEIETIPGITSFGAGASRIGLPITVRGESFYLCDGEIDMEVLGKVDSVAILKTSRYKQENIEKLEQEGFNYSYLKRCSRDDEKVIIDREEILEDRDYMSLIIGRRL